MRGDFQTRAGYSDLRPAQVAAAFDRFDHVLDVRQPGEFHGDLGHIEGARLVPLADLPGALGALDPNASYLLICRSGNRSGQACAWMARQGFQRLTNLDGGMLAWNDAGLPVAR